MTRMSNFVTVSLLGCIPYGSEIDINELLDQYLKVGVVWELESKLSFFQVTWQCAVIVVKTESLSGRVELHVDFMAPDCRLRKWSVWVEEEEDILY